MGRQFLDSVGAVLVIVLAFAPQSSAVEPSHSLQSRLLADAADGRLDQHAWIAAALVAGGIDQPRTLDRLLARYAHVRRQLLAARHAPPSGHAADLSERLQRPGEQGTALLEWMHREILTGSYCRECSNLADALDRGDFNCVSSAVLYLALATELNMKCQLVERPEHVWIEWLSPDGVRAVETTSADGALPPAAQTHGSRLRRLSQVESVALIYFNRGTIYFECGELKPAIAANLVALRLDPARTGARHNLLAAVNNEAVELCRQNQFEAALELLECGLALAPGEPSLLANRRLAEQQRLRRGQSTDLTNVGL